MARIYGFSGKIVGKKGDAVFRVQKGKQFVSQYNPIVVNPNTEKQTVQRAKMKLLSQLSAIFTNVIAIPSEGTKTTRNIFTKINFPLIQRAETNGEVKVEADLLKIQLTKSSRAMCPIAAGVPFIEENIRVGLLRNCANEFDRVVYTVVNIQTDGSMSVILSHTVSEAGFDGRFMYEFAPQSTNILIYAYGVKDLSSKAYTIFADTKYSEGEAVASVISNRKVSAADAQVTQTVGLMLTTDTQIVASNGLPTMFVTNPDEAHILNTGAFFVQEGDLVNLNFEVETGYHFDSGYLIAGAEDSISWSANPWTWSVNLVEDEVVYMMSVSVEAN